MFEALDIGWKFARSPFKEIKGNIENIFDYSTMRIRKNIFIWMRLRSFVKLSILAIVAWLKINQIGAEKKNIFLSSVFASSTDSTLRNDKFSLIIRFRSFASLFACRFPLKFKIHPQYNANFTSSLFKCINEENPQRKLYGTFNYQLQKITFNLRAPVFDSYCGLVATSSRAVQNEWKKIELHIVHIRLDCKFCALGKRA